MKTAVRLTFRRKARSTFFFFGRSTERGCPRDQSIECNISDFLCNVARKTFFVCNLEICWILKYARKSIFIFSKISLVQRICCVKRIFGYFFRPKRRKIGLFFDFLVRFCHLRLQKRGKLVFKISQTVFEIKKCDFWEN